MGISFVRFTTNSHSTDFLQRDTQTTGSDCSATVMDIILTSFINLVSTVWSLVIHLGWNFAFAVQMSPKNQEQGGWWL